MTTKFFRRVGVIGGVILAFTLSAQAQTGTRNAPPSKDDIVKALTPAPAVSRRARGIGRRGLGRANATAAAPQQPPSSEMSDSTASTYFEFNSSQLTPFGLRVVNEYVKALKDPALSSYAFRIIGHTDGVGGELYNDALSQRRARTVRDYMIAHGVDPMRLDVMGMGERDLKNRADPASPENRRVVIVNLGRR
jgi:outer membrane protein OmpA-like peptidoglycan-associated protein